MALTCEKNALLEVLWHGLQIDTGAPVRSALHSHIWHWAGWADRLTRRENTSVKYFWELARPSVIFLMLNTEPSVAWASLVQVSGMLTILENSSLSPTSFFSLVCSLVNAASESIPMESTK